MNLHYIPVDGEDTGEYIHLYNVPAVVSFSEHIPSTKCQQSNYGIGNSPNSDRGCTLGVTWVLKLWEGVNPRGEYFAIKH